MRSELDLVSRDGVTVLAAVSSEDGVLKFEEGSALLRKSFEHWFVEGFEETVLRDEPEHEYDRVWRHTPPDHPDFLERVGEFVIRQTGFSMKIRYIP